MSPPTAALGWPNRISIARITLVVPFLAAVFLGLPNLRPAIVGAFVLMAASDFLDGYLARRLGQTSALGRLLDPLADKLLINFTFLLLAIRGIPAGDRWLTLPDWVVLVTWGKDALLIAGVVGYHRAARRWVIEPSRLGKWTTTVQLATIFVFLVAPALPDDLPLRVAQLAGVLAAAAAVDYVRRGLRIVADGRRSRSEGRETV